MYYEYMRFEICPPPERLNFPPAPSDLSAGWPFRWLALSAGVACLAGELPTIVANDEIKKDLFTAVIILARISLPAQKKAFSVFSCSQVSPCRSLCPSCGSAHIHLRPERTEPHTCLYMHAGWNSDVRTIRSLRGLCTERVLVKYVYACNCMCRCILACKWHHTCICVHSHVLLCTCLYSIPLLVLYSCAPFIQMPCMYMRVPCIKLGVTAFAAA